MQIFVSYKSENVNRIRTIVDVIKSKGIDVWFAEYEVLSSNYDKFEEKLSESLDRALNSSTHALLFTNNLWLNSEYCQLEFNSLIKLPKNKIIQVCYPLEKGAEKVKLREDINSIDLNEQNFIEVINFILTNFKITSNNRINNYPLEIKSFKNLEFRYGKAKMFPNFRRMRSSKNLGLVGRNNEFVYGFEFQETWCRIEINIDPFNTPDDSKKYIEYWTVINEGDIKSKKQAYKKLRAKARKYIGGQKLYEYGLHIYMYKDFGHIGLTYWSRGKTDPNYITWYRFYSITIWDNKYSKPITVTFEFTVFNKHKSFDETEKIFFKLLPYFDLLVETYEYSGHPSLKHVPKRNKVKLWETVGALLGITIGFLLFYFTYQKIFALLGNLDIYLKYVITIILGLLIIKVCVWFFKSLASRIVFNKYLNALD